MIGIGGAPTRATTLPEEPAERKKYPIATGFFDYFPDAIVAISNVSWAGNEQHNPGKPLHWDRSKSADEADTCLRHFAQRGTLDTDGKRHTAKAAWRILALLQKEIELENAQQQKAWAYGPGEVIKATGILAGVDVPPMIPCRVREYMERGDVVKVMDDHHENFVPAKKMGLTPDDRYVS